MVDCMNCVTKGTNIVWVDVTLHVIGPLLLELYRNDTEDYSTGKLVEYILKYVKDTHFQDWG